MTTLLTILISIGLFAQAIIPDGKKPMVSKAEALAAIDRFLANPGPGENASAINQFAEQSEDVTIAVSASVMPWLKVSPLPKYNSALVTGFVAGNVKSQLDSGNNADDPYAGLLAVFKVYDKLREKDKDFKVAEIEDLMAKEKKGELKAWTEKASKAAAREHGDR